MIMPFSPNAHNRAKHLYWLRYEQLVRHVLFKSSRTMHYLFATARPSMTILMLPCALYALIFPKGHQYLVQKAFRQWCVKICSFVQGTYKKFPHVSKRVVCICITMEGDCKKVGFYKKKTWEAGVKSHTSKSHINRRNSFWRVEIFL